MITTENLCVRFSDGTGIRYADLKFEQGRSYALLGASGCGKSTLLNMIAGVLSPTEGRVCVDGECISEWPQRRRDAFRIRQVGYIYQDFKLINGMSVQDNIDMLRMEGINTDGKDALLDKLGILSLKKRRVRSLSGGERQRVAIVRALIKRPSIILADEPTGNLNYETGCEVMRQLIENTGNGTLIAVTHDDRLAPMFDNVLNMNDIASFETGKEAAVNA